jgi:molybdate transport system substrate-binding protein
VTIRTIGLVLAIGLVVVGCGPGPAATRLVASAPPTTAGSASPAPTPAELTIFAAASLKDVLDDVTATYAGAQPDVTVTVSTDSSATLRTQIEQGAPADVFLSADTKNPQTLVDGGLTTGAASPFASNTLTVIVPTANPAGITSPMDLGLPGVKIIAAGDDVPITRYATEAVGKLAGLEGYPTDFAAAYAANVVSREDNVGAIVAKIELGEGDAGIVYATDATAVDAVARITIPEAGNAVTTYAGVILKPSRHVDAAQAFLDWLIGAGGQAILARHGFLPPAQ